VRSLATHVQPIFTTVCAGCHAATFPSGGLDLTDGAAAGHLVGIASAGCPSLTRVTACGALPSQSLLIDKLQAGQPGGLPPSCGGPMPAFGSITPAEFDSIVDWVAQGAPP
jgi:mono/diheme cytochrome c family protein